MPSLFWGFRLTIWNVNALVAVVPELANVGFRLTIWNVNKSLPYLVSSYVLVLD